MRGPRRESGEAHHREELLVDLNEHAVRRRTKDLVVSAAKVGGTDAEGREDEALDRIRYPVERSLRDKPARWYVRADPGGMHGSSVGARPHYNKVGHPDSEYEKTGEKDNADPPSARAFLRFSNERVDSEWQRWNRGDHRASVHSTMLHVKIDRDEPTELFEQVAAEIRRAIADGEAKPGERLPPARDLAAVLGVNTNTVLRSLRLLRDEGLLDFRRGRGIHVAGTPEQGAVVARARALSASRGRQGYRPDELARLIESLS